MQSFCQRARALSWTQKITRRCTGKYSGATTGDASHVGTCEISKYTTFSSAAIVDRTKKKI